MDKNEKFIWSAFSVLAICMPIGYAAARFNPNFATLMACIGVMALGASLGALYAGFNVCTTEQPRKSSYEDEVFDCAKFNDWVGDLDVVADKIETVCDALEKIASVKAAGMFDARDVMDSAIDFRERANELRHRAGVIAQSRRNRKFEGIKELIATYSSEPMFDGFRETIQSYLPESYQIPKYLDVDEEINSIYDQLLIMCDEQK